MYYERALTLSRVLPGIGRERFLATWGKWFHETMSRRNADALKLADELVVIARELDDSDLMVEAYHAQMPTLLWQGDLSATNEAAQNVIRLYDRERHRDHAYYFGGHATIPAYYSRRIVRRRHCSLAKRRWPHERVNGSDHPVPPHWLLRRPHSLLKRNRRYFYSRVIY